MKSKKKTAKFQKSRERLFRFGIVIESILLIFLAVSMISHTQNEQGVMRIFHKDKDEKEDKFIKWVTFDISYEALCQAYQIDMDTFEEENHVNWIELLAYIGAKNGGKFPSGTRKQMNDSAEKLISGETTIKELTKDMEYYDYYYKAYSAVLEEYVGEYEMETTNEEGKVTWQKKYGLKVFSPIAGGFPYNDYDDFGSNRSYGYSRPHLGHDMMGQIGTPIIAIESGYVEAIGWNQYGGWRLGIRSFDKKRYYYYAHMRQNFPYCKELKEGSVVTAGDVIGYMGHTGYSTKENVNNIKVTHLHWGLQLIFDESQKEGNNEIWVNCYPLSQFLYKNRSQTQKNEKTKEWHRIYQMKDPEVEQQKNERNTGFLQTE